MSWLTDSVLFSGGIVLAAVSLIAGGLCLLLLRRSKKRLDGELDEEYGRPIR